MHRNNLTALTLVALFAVASYAQPLNIEGCEKCVQHRCPKVASQCPLGLVNDICGCCSQGVCAKIEGEECYNSTLVPPPSIETKKYGTCGKDLNCLYTNDAVNWDIPHAICVCEDTRMVCATTNQTFSSACELNQEAIKNNLSPDVFYIKNYGPCIAIPTISSRPTDAIVDVGQSVVLSCEVKGYPIPIVTWDFTSRDNKEKKQLPADVSHIAVQSRGGPDDYMTTSWVQIVQVHSSDAGVYTCTATNDLGYTKAAGKIQIRKIREEV